MSISLSLASVLGIEIFKVRVGLLHSIENGIADLSSASPFLTT